MKRIAIILVVIVAVLAISVAAAPFVVSSAFLRQQVADRIATLTGRTVAFSGEPSLSIYPQLAVTVDGLTIANPEDMGSDPFVAAESLRTRLRLPPLLIGRVEFDEFELIKPTIHLVIDGEGRKNWRIAGSAVANQAAVAAPATAGKASPPLADLQLGRLKVTNGTILYDDLVSGTREEMAAVDLDIAWPSVSATVSGRGTLKWRGEQIEFTALLATPLALMRGGGAPARFAIASTPLRASFSGTAMGADVLRLEGEASVSTPSMRRTIEWLGTPMGTGPILGAAAIRGSVGIVGASVSFDRATIELDGNSAEGALGVTFAGARPAVHGTLAAERLDLSAYFEAIRADLIAEGSWLVAPARLAFAEAVDADIRISAAEMILGSIRIGKTAAAVGIKDGKLDIAVGEAEFYGGNLAARIAAGLEGEVLATTAHAKFTDVSALVALNDLVGIAALDGTATVTVDVGSRGRSWAEVAHGIAGTANVAITNGALNGLDVDAIAEAMTDPLAEPITAGGGTTAFSSLAADLAIGEGDLSTDDLVMEGDTFRVALAGRGSVLNESVDAKARLTLGTAELSLVIAGTWQAPLVAREPTVPGPAVPTPPTLRPTVPAPTGG